VGFIVLGFSDVAPVIVVYVGCVFGTPFLTEFVVEAHVIGVL